MKGMHSCGWLDQPPFLFGSAKNIEHLALCCVGASAQSHNCSVSARVQMHPRLRPAMCIVLCIIVCQISQLSPHVLIQSMRTSFCIYRLMNRQNIGYNYKIWAMGARNGLLSVILSEGDIRIPALFSLLMPTFRGRNQRFIMECTLRWTVAWYRPQCEVPSKVCKIALKCTPESGHVKSPNPNSWTMKSLSPEKWTH